MKTVRLKPSVIIHLLEKKNRHLNTFPLQVIALGTIGEILQKQDQKEYLAELSQRFAEFYAIKKRFSKIETTARTYDKIQELFKQYLKKEDYNKFKDQINQTPLWLIQDMEGYITSVQ